ncbi:hypothetical protein EYY87_08520 [Hafnia paralvei]|uniref:tail fiber/spike domain-containing protein n=1 Tax=Hafnia paralvei TaxID=546367 RepID=UPI0010354203|nr:hypothetical protein [Hafnia paralvei]TBM05633.1 hypothetical protein EYY87_08520 [Hafnia paralvei]
MAEQKVKLTQLPEATDTIDSAVLLVNQNETDQRLPITHFLRAKNNLSELENAEQARANLGVPSVEDVNDKVEYLIDGKSTFLNGATLESERDFIWDDNSKSWYYWTGTFSKEVPAASTPESTGGIGAGAWLSIGDAVLRTELADKKGYSLIGELLSISEFYGMVGYNGEKVKLKSWYQSGELGGGYFYYDESIPRNKHDGGVIISPTAVYSGESDISGFINAGSEQAGSGCWVRVGVDEINGSMYGLSGNPTSEIIDGTASIKKMVAMAAERGYGVSLPANPIIINSPISIPMHQRDGGKVRYFRGSSEKESLIYINAQSTTSTAFGLTFEGSLSVDSSFYVNDFAIKSVNSDGTTADWAGYGIKFNKVIRLDWRRVSIGNFNVGVNFTDTLYITMDTLRLYECISAMHGRLGETTGANLVSINRVDFVNNAQFCIELQHSHSWLITACSFEGNGGKSYANGTQIDFNSCVQLAQVGGAGMVSANVECCYFEKNTGRDINFYINRNLSQKLSIKNTNFNKTAETTASRVVVSTNQTDLGNGVVITLDMQGNGFFKAGSFGDSYKDVEFVGFSKFGEGHLKFYDYNNTYSASIPYGLSGKIQHIIPNSPLASCWVAANGAYIQGINSVVIRSSTGTYTVNFPMNMSLAMPNITMLGGSGRYASIARNSNYQWTVSTYNSTGSLADLEFILSANQADHTG